MKLVIKNSDKNNKSYNSGYDKGIQDSITTIIKILNDNDITMKEAEFWKEFKLLKKEGAI